jgi:cytochrome c biogenesis protein CcdA/thiol-disulfide isomerase/thioredoxin
VLPVILFAFAAGILTIVAPCTLPVLPAVLGGGIGPGRHRLLGLCLGFGGTFLALTFLIASALAALGLTSSTLRPVAALVLLAAGATLALPAIGRLVERVVQRRGGPPGPLASTGNPGDSGFWRGLAMGSALGLIWAPCVGPLMGPVIAAAVVEGPTLEGVAVGGAYVVGAVIPIAIIAAMGRRVTRRVDARATDQVRRAFGAGMVVVALVVLTGTDASLAATLTAAFPTQAGTQFEAAGAGASTRPEDTILTTDGAALEDLGAAPELSGITAWINSNPLTLASLRGRVVLVEFWTFGCINCIHVAPYVRAWYDTYGAQGFTVIGVHTPELSFERDLGNVRDAVAKAGIRYPVAFDPDFATWRAYQNQYWPAFYLIDKRGHVRLVKAGEGGYDASEAAIRALLAEPG